MKTKQFLIITLVVGLLFFGYYKTQAALLRPGVSGGLLAPIDLSGLVMTMASPLTIDGTSNDAVIAADSATSTIPGNLSLLGHLLPSPDGTLDIGSVTRTFRNVYASGTLSLYQATISASGLTATRTMTFPDKAGTISIFSSVPTASSTPCVVGEFAATSSAIYICVSTNLWTRATSTIDW